MLALQLAQLEEDGWLIAKQDSDDDRRATEYVLTPFGQTLAPVIEAMAAWGAAYCAREKERV